MRAAKGLFNYCFTCIHLPLFVGVLCWSLFWYALFCVLSSFAIILTRKRELVALLLLSFGCLLTVNVLWLFLTVPLVGLQCWFVVFPDKTRFLARLRWYVGSSEPSLLICDKYQTHELAQSVL